MKMNQTLKRNVLVLGGIAAACIAAIGGLVWYTTSSAPQQSGATSTVRVDSAKLRQDRAPSPAVVESSDRFDRQQAASAAASGRSYVPSMIVAPGAPVELPKPASAPASSANAAPTPYEVQAQQERLRSQREDDDRRRQIASEEARKQLEEYNANVKAALEQLAEAAKANKTPMMETFRMPEKKDGRSGGAPGSAGPGVAVSPAASAPALFGGVRVVKALDIVGAVLEAPIDTSKSNRVLVRVVSGPLDGAIMMGQATIVNDEGLNVQITRMTWREKSYKVNATLLDEASSLDALEKGVAYDRKVMERWVLPIAMAAVGGYHDARSRTGSTTITGVSGSTVVNQPSSGDQARSAGIAKGVQMAERRIDREAEKPITARIERGATVGVIFNEEVKE